MELDLHVFCTPSATGPRRRGLRLAGSITTGGGRMRSRKFSDEELLDAAEQLGLGAYVARRIS